MKREPIFPMPQAAPDADAEAAVLREVARQLAGLRFGSIEIVVHDGVVTQIERREKVRFAAGMSGRTC